MRKVSIKSMFAVVLLSAWSSLSMGSTILYTNDFNGALSYGINALPSGTGLVDSGLVPTPHPEDCLYIQGLGALSVGCSSNHNPAAGIPGNIHALLPSPFYLTADSNGVPINISSSDPVITVDITMTYFHDVNAKASKQQAKFYNTDVNDSRLGWGFFALTSADSPANVCLGITANKIIAFVDGVSQTSSLDTGPGFNFITEKELADYVPGVPVNIKIRVDKVHHTGTYLINNVPKLVVDLAGALPANDLTLVSQTVLAPRGARPSSLENWSLGWIPVLSHLDLASLGSAKGRNTAGGLLDAQFTSTFFGLNQVYPSIFAQPFDSWVDNYAFGTTYFTSINSIKVYSDGL